MPATAEKHLLSLLLVWHRRKSGPLWLFQHLSPGSTCPVLKGCWLFQATASTPTCLSAPLPEECAQHSPSAPSGSTARAARAASRTAGKGRRTSPGTCNANKCERAMRRCSPLPPAPCNTASRAPRWKSCLDEAPRRADLSFGGQEEHPPEHTAHAQSRSRTYRATPGPTAVPSMGTKDNCGSWPAAFSISYHSRRQTGYPWKE